MFCTLAIEVPSTKRSLHVGIFTAD
jgi:hypothetical protein